MISEQRTSQAVELGAFVLGYLSAYFVSTAVAIPLPWYFPTEHRWVFGVRPVGLAADFYGRLALCVLAGAVFAAGARALKRPAAPGGASSRLTLFIVWNGTLFIFCAGLYVYLLMGRENYPAPLPPGYVPR